MARNVEIKARVKDFSRLRELALQLSQGKEELIRQKDTFYNVPHGRLKLREFGDGTGQLIAYERPDHTGPKTSRYEISPTNDPAALHRALAMSLTVRGVVSKERILILAERTRIHLDRVAGLGEFMELEVVLRPDESEADGLVVAHQLMADLEIVKTDLVDGAYIDHLEVKGISAAPS